MCDNSIETTLGDVPAGSKLVLTLSLSYDATFDRRLRWLDKGWERNRDIDVNPINGELRIPHTGNYLVIITSGAPGLLLHLAIFEPKRGKDCAKETPERTIDVSLGHPNLVALEKGARLLVVKNKENTVKAPPGSTKLFLFWQEA